ncbi:MAG: DNA alkylation repair protein [Clostridia bacterium]|nr:DNA alkylation repair protein [Clostridia bacterium]
MKEIITFLNENADAKYREFNKSITPGQNMLGVRTPILREYARELYKTKPNAVCAFMDELPHEYFEENQLHAFLICCIKDFDVCLEEVKRFLPYVDNWATCDQMNPKALSKNRDILISFARKCVQSDKTFTIRYGIKILMDYCLGDYYDKSYTDIVCAVDSEEYYVKMMVAWYMATALAKNYEEVLPYIENGILPKWTHNKAIQKACESYRVSDIHKAYIRKLKI